MAGFGRIGDTLSVDGIEIESIASKFGTPIFIYSAAAIEEAYKQFRAATDGDINYAVKANSNLAVLRLLARCGAGADIVSGGELARALKAGFSADKIVFSGVGKSDDELKEALKCEIGQINAESESEVQRILDLAKNSSVRLGLRVNLNVTPETHAKISTGGSTTKFGIPASEVKRIYHQISSSESVNLGGLAVHIGSQIMDKKAYKVAWQELKKLADDLVAEGLEVPSLDLGGGFGVDYKSGEPADIKSITALASEIFSGTGYGLSFEPGRWLLAEAGALIVSVLHVKETEGKQFIITDGAMNDLIRPTLYDAYHRVEPIHKNEGKMLESDIVGPICETGDYFALGRKMPLAKRGDLLAIMSAGAYGAVMRSNYNSRPFASEVMVIKGKAHAISAKQSVEDLLAQDRIPQDLA